MRLAILFLLAVNFALVSSRMSDFIKVIVSPFTCRRTFERVWTTSSAYSTSWKNLSIRRKIKRLFTAEKVVAAEKEVSNREVSKVLGEQCECSYAPNNVRLANVKIKRIP